MSALLGGMSGDAAQVKPFYAGGVGGAKERADIVQAAHVVEQDRNGQLGDGLIRRGGLSGEKRDTLHGKAYSTSMVILSGTGLSVEQVHAVAVCGEQVQIAPEARERMQASRAVVERLADWRGSGLRA